MNAFPWDFAVADMQQVLLILWYKEPSRAAGNFNAFNIIIKFIQHYRFAPSFRE